MQNTCVLLNPRYRSVNLQYCSVWNYKTHLFCGAKYYSVTECVHFAFWAGSTTSIRRTIFSKLMGAQLTWVGLWQMFVKSKVAFECHLPKHLFSLTTIYINTDHCFVLLCVVHMKAALRVVPETHKTGEYVRLTHFHLECSRWSSIHKLLNREIFDKIFEAESWT